MPKTIHAEPYKQLCALLVQCRKDAGLSQYDLAARLGRPQSFVAKVEKCERRIDVLEFLDITHSLNLDPCDILRVVQRSAKKSKGSAGS